ncbi:MAG: hypothetical protein DMF69_17345 [Acidobacteria bacterium]|nr:MAG: hypothetical protein DMF69_17345 [Acidobacteriota bacterium]
MSKGRILCTEDDVDSREMIVTMLEISGYEVVCPADSALALELAEHQPFDLCLLDNWAVGLTGVELTKRIRTFDRKVPILFYSGVAGNEEQHKAMNAGAQAYLIKPAGIGNLTEEIDRLIQHSRSATT